MVNHHCCLQFGAAAAAATADGGFAPQYRRPVFWNAVIMLTMIKEIVTTIYGRRKGKERSGWHKKRHKFSHHLLYGHNVGRIKFFFFRLIHDSNSLSNLLFFFFSYSTLLIYNAGKPRYNSRNSCQNGWESRVLAMAGGAVRLTFLPSHCHTPWIMIVQALLLTVKYQTMLNHLQWFSIISTIP